MRTEQMPEDEIADLARVGLNSRGARDRFALFGTAPMGGVEGLGSDGTGS